MGSDRPSVLHTLHWDLTKHRVFYSGFGNHEHFSVNGVSAAQLRHAPEGLRRVQPRARLSGHPAGAPRHPSAGPCQGRSSGSCRADQPEKRAAHRRAAGTAVRVGAGARRTDRAIHRAGGTRRRSRTPIDTPTCGTGARRSPRMSTATGCGGSAMWKAWSVTTSSRPRGRRCFRCAGTSRAVPRSPNRWRSAPRWSATAVAACPNWSNPEPDCSPSSATKPRWHSWSHEVDTIDPAHCRAIAERRFTPAVMAAAYLELYDRCMTGSLAANGPRFLHRDNSAQRRQGFRISSTCCLTFWSIRVRELDGTAERA